MMRIIRACFPKRADEQRPHFPPSASSMSQRIAKVIFTFVAMLVIRKRQNKAAARDLSQPLLRFGWSRAAARLGRSRGRCVLLIIPEPDQFGLRPELAEVVVSSFWAEMT
jgi:hypothetical protein